MAQATAHKLYNNLALGLITEASPLTYAEGSTSDELNMNIYKGGNRSRRFGIDYTTPIVVGDTLASLDTKAVTEYKWTAAANLATATFIVVQIGVTLLFYNTAGTSLVDSIDMTPYVMAGKTVDDVKGLNFSFAAGNGFLFVCSKYTEPVVIEFDGTSSFTATRLYVLIRDFIGLDDGLGPDEQPATLSDEHQYNLQNQGWLVGYNESDGPTVTYWTQFGVQSTYATSIDSVIDTFHTSVGTYPPNSKSWWWAQSDGFTLDPQALNNLPAGNILAPKGHYVVNAFYVDRSAVSAIGAFDVDEIDERPVSVSYFAGRVWYGCQSTVYFSRVLEPNTYYKANFCCQEADPTSQQISDLVATDGGTILINDIGTILRLYSIGSGMLVFGTEGVAFIQGGNGGFSALDFAVSKMSPIGMNAPLSVIEVDSQIFWMSNIGIQGMDQKNGIFGPIQGNFNKLNISLDTIQSWYNEHIPPAKRVNVKALYDPSINTIRWLYREDRTGFNQYDGALNLDLDLQAFYPWKFSYASGYPIVLGGWTDPTSTNITAGNVIRSDQLTYLAVIPVGSNYNLAFCKTSNTNFGDWDAFGTPLAYDSFVESGFEILQDAERRKWLPYLFAYFRRTETDIVDGEPLFPSSCMLQVKWDFSNSTVANKWTTPIQAYRVIRQPFYDANDPSVDNGYSVIVTKNKIRGTGKSIQFRFYSSELGKDFDLLGWATSYTGNTVS